MPDVEKVTDSQLNRLEGGMNCLQTSVNNIALGHGISMLLFTFQGC